MNEPITELESKPFDLATLNRSQRRQFRRAILSEHRKKTRFWRRASRGVMPQWQIAALVRSTDKRNKRIDAEYGVSAVTA
jgi:hypothetical protein